MIIEKCQTEIFPFFALHKWKQGTYVHIPKFPMIKLFSRSPFFVFCHLIIVYRQQHPGLVVVY